MKIVPPLSERDIANALGLLCIANEVTAEARAAALAAFRGPVDTSDEGRRVYYVQIDTCGLDNTDEEEAIWSVGDDGMLRGASGEVIADLADEDSTYAVEVVPLAWLTQPDRMARAEKRWLSDSDQARRAAWAAFQRRIVAPLGLLIRESSK